MAQIKSSQILRLYRRFKIGKKVRNYKTWGILLEDKSKLIPYTAKVVYQILSSESD